MCRPGHMKYETAGDMVEFTVEDNGIGIPACDLSRVFQKGFTGENGRVVQKSTGMGLYLCKKLCDKMDIPLAIRSKQGEGTKLIFQLKKASQYLSKGIGKLF